MILRGISSPVQGEDAANKAYVDALSKKQSALTLSNTNGVIAKSTLSTDAEDKKLFIMTPFYVASNYAYFLVDIYQQLTGNKTVNISGCINKSIKSVTFIVGDLATPYGFVDETRLYYRNGIVYCVNNIIGRGLMKVGF